MSKVNQASKPYFDDYDKEKEYYKVLFRPSYAVQTRELNQLQTMFEKQVERFGHHVFKNGSVVVPGALNYDTQYQYVKVTIDDYQNVIENIRNNNNLRLVTQDDGLIAEVKEFVDIDGNDPATFYVRYTNSGNSKNVRQFVTNKTVNIVDSVNALVGTAKITEVGTGTKATIADGVYFAFGRFVLVPTHSQIISKYDNQPTVSVGLTYNELAVTENDDPSLVDNAAGSPNFTAPGAHRLKVDLILTHYPVDEVDEHDDYIELLVLEDGKVRKQARGPEYNVLGQTLAQRTYEESGDYTVKPFSVDVTEHLDDSANGIDGQYTAAEGGDESKYCAIVDPGLAYVRGYRVESKKSTIKSVDKSRKTDIGNNVPSIVQYGSYIEVENVYGAPVSTSFDQITFYDSNVTTGGTEPSGSKLGTAAVRTVKLTGSDDGQLFLTNIRDMSGVRTTSFLSDAKSVYLANGSSTFTADLVDASLFDTNVSSALIPLDFDFVKTLLDQSQSTDTTYTVLRKFTATVNGSNELILTCGTNEKFLPFDSTYSYVIDDDQSGQLIEVTGSTLGGSPTGTNMTLEVDSTYNGDSCTVVMQVTKQQAFQRNKSVVTDSVVGTPTSNKLDLGYTDAFELTKVTDNNSVDVTSKFTLQPNMTADYYGISYVEQTDGGVAYPITVDYKYFSHGSGDYFSVDSYAGIDYQDIPSFDGRRLSDYMDFRPDIDTSTKLQNQTNDLIYDGSFVSVDLTYYLSRIDKVVVNSDGQFSVIKGASSLSPKPPATPENSLVLAQVYLPPYTVNANLVDKEAINNRRYTMSDIASLEERIEDLEYHVSLSMLEQQTMSTNIYDTGGFDRFKNGFLVNAFKDHSLGDWTNPDYHCSVGPMGSRTTALRPEYTINQIDTKLDQTNSQNVVVKNGMAMLDYSEVKLAKQDKASNSINVNPYAVFRYDGVVKLTPSADNWIDTVYNRPKVNYTLIKNGNLQQSWSDFGLAWGSKSSHKTESKVIDERTLSVSQQRNQPWIEDRGIFWESKIRVGDYSHRSTGTRFLKQQTIETTTTDTDIEETGNKIINRTAIPYMRSKELAVELKGMKPNTKLFFFFDDVAVDNEMKPTGGQYGHAIATDASGHATGTFKIPSKKDKKFRVGTRVFDVTDYDGNNPGQAQTYAQTEYTAEGTRETRQREFNATRSINSTQHTETTGQVKYRDPLAQSFLIEDEGGVFLTSVDLYFRNKDQDIPITLDIRAMENGFPTQNIVPGTRVMLDSSEVNVSGDGLAATKFEFDYPVHLKNGHEYCFVLMANSVQYDIWIATMGESDINTNVPITEQPATGVLFKSQNSSTWSEDQQSDIKFQLNRAKFDTTGGQIRLNNVDQDDVPLRNNPILTHNGQTYFDVLIPGGHNYIAGESITLSGLTSGNGFDASDLNKTHKIDQILDPETIRIDPEDVSGTSDSRIGGNSGFRSHKIQYNALDVNVEELSFGQTDIQYLLKSTTGQSFSGTEVPYIYQNNWQPVVNKKLNFFDHPMCALNEDEETDKISGEKSFRIQIDLSTETDRLSPMVDLQRCAFVSPLFLIDDNGTDHDDGQDCFAQYQTIPVSIEHPTVAIQFYGSEHVPENSRLIYSYRVANSKDELISADWQALHTSQNRIGSTYKEMQELIEADTDFTWIQFKIQMKSTSVASVPSVSNIRFIALGT